MVKHVCLLPVAPPSTSFRPDFVVVGNHVTATCSVAANFNIHHNITSFIWSHNGTVIKTLSNPNGKYAISSDRESGVSGLEVNQLVQEDAGVYRCTVEYSLVSEPQNILSVQSEDSLSIASKLFPV